MACDRRRLVLAALLAALAACGRKGEPEPPSGARTPERTYPKPDPVPWQTPPQPKT
jgi:predicted small lipoprotein YifL